MLPSWIANQLPPGSRSYEIAVAGTEARPTGGERMAALVWGPDDAKHTIVLVHGNPTWGFLWREVVRRLEPGWKLVVPDLIGLGRSSKPEIPAHTIEHHGAWLGALIDQLAPNKFVIAAQDWGGPIALTAAATRLDRVRGIVLGNTAVSPPGPTFKPTLFHRLSQLPIASDILFRRLGFPLGALHLSQGDRGSIRGDVAKAYRWPLRDARDRAAPLALARMVPNSQTHVSVPALRKTHELFATIDVPIGIVWGMRDPILGRVINHLERTRPDAKITRTQAGHFLQEEVPAELATSIRDVVARASW